MKSIVLIVTVLAVAVAGGMLFKTVLVSEKSPLPDQPATSVIKQLFEKEKPSPYSLNVGSPMACVVDQQGDGVADATVTFKASLKRDCDGNITQEPPDWQGMSVTTNEKGEFTFPPELWIYKDAGKNNSVNADIEANGFLKRSVGVGVNYGNDHGRIDLLRTGCIEGALIGPDGEPVANAPVYLSTGIQYQHPNSSCHGCFSANVKTDEAGSFVFNKVPAGIHFVKFPGHAGGCGPDESEVIPYKEYATFQMVQMADGVVKSDVFLDLRQNSAMIQGKVVDKQNRPMAGVNAILSRKVVHYEKDGSGWSSFTDNLKSAMTDEKGYYILDRIPPGDYELKASYPYEKGKNYKSGDAINVYVAVCQQVPFNLVLERQDDSQPKKTAEEALFDVPLPDNLSFDDVMIVDPTGKGIAGAEVEIKGPIKIRDGKTKKETLLPWDGVRLTTNERGVFKLPDVLQVGKGKTFNCQIHVKADGFQMRGTSLRSYVLKYPRIDLLPLSGIRGRIIGFDGEPASISVEIREQMTAYNNPGSSSHGIGNSFRTTADDGYFEMGNVPNGVHVVEYTVVYADRSKKRSQGKMIVYTDGTEDVDGLVIDLRHDICAVKGRVLDWDGKPVKKAEVRLCKEISIGRKHHGTSTSWPVFYQSEKTNRKGQYGIEDVRPGIYQIEATLDGDRRRTSEKKTIAIGDGQAAEIDLRLKP